MESSESLDHVRADQAGDIRVFMRAWALDPLRIASVVPSGRSLARAMTAAISAETGAVIELGPGLGSFTRELLRRGICETRLALIESCDAFVARLQGLFPNTSVIGMDASRLHRVELFGRGQAGAVVSGLPLLSMPMGKVMAILRGAFGHLRPDGAFYQFTYGPFCPVPRRVLDRLELQAARVGRALLNFPPASVYRIQRRQPQPLAQAQAHRVRLPALSPAYSAAAAHE